MDAKATGGQRGEHPRTRGLAYETRRKSIAFQASLHNIYYRAWIVEPSLGVIDVNGERLDDLLATTESVARAL